MRAQRVSNHWRVHEYVDVWRDYFNFSGRARRKEYWFFTLIHGLIAIAGELLAGSAIA